MRRADRLLHLLQILRRHRRPVTADVIAAELEVSVRTVYRDVAALIGQGVPVRGEAGIGYVLDRGFDMPPLMFTPDELEAVMLGLRWVVGRGDRDLARAALDVVAKIEAMVPERLRPVFLDNRLLVPPPWTENPSSVDLGELRVAIRDGRKLRLLYRAEDGQETDRIVWPLALTYYESKRIAVAWCELRQGFRHFRTDRILELEPLAERIPGRRAVLLQAWQQEVRDRAGLPHLDLLGLG
ncbi:YafY family protein [Chelatococcus sp. SYSU_G07232]|uniref:YafY family protein n=1 Tax=Chelatococcus albus TaxID=3047466 RepID=A0ABT7ACQ6_9HYPH|nr:YafY family protein [Chelatococcus sp. SYSU_G07232]MDJ1157157.1 YafY family protein [Chelatococcus sp. SYSU_G07232]